MSSNVKFSEMGTSSHAVSKPLIEQDHEMLRLKYRSNLMVRVEDLNGLITNQV